MEKKFKNSGKNPIDNLKPAFTSENQPSPEAKKAGWERRRAAQEIMNELDAIRQMPYEELEKMKQDIKSGNFKGYTVQQVKLMQYMGSSKFTTDWLDRHVSKAPQDINLSAEITNKPMDLSLLSEDELKNLEAIALKSARPDSD